ncbi:MAG: type IV secretion protein IcmS [Gammaproteobacteria bacterium]|nr:type IV secretion protein IcmS [Gammaproteobacteria bacterium]MCH9744107.1 type IV secretion protein IcmS [Gammaproteobacteria bacterium]
MSDLDKKLIAIAKKMGVTFTLKGRPIALSEMFSDMGLLPGLAKRADQLASLCLGYGIGATFEDAEKSILGSKVKFDDFTPEIIRVFCIVDVIYELIKTSPTKGEVSLDELMYD